MTSFYVYGCTRGFSPLQTNTAIPLNITFNLLDTTASFCSDLWYVLRSSTNNGCVIVWLEAWDKLHPSVLLKYHVMGFSTTVNDLTQKNYLAKSLCSLLLYWPSLYPRSSVILCVFITDLIRFIRLKCIPYISSVSSSPPNCSISSSFGSVHPLVPFKMILSINKFSAQAIVFALPSLINLHQAIRFLV